MDNIIMWLENPAAYLTGMLWEAGTLCCPISHCQMSPSQQLKLLIYAARLLVAENTQDLATTNWSTNMLLSYENLTIVTL